jgi:hypothetical protein
VTFFLLGVATVIAMFFQDILAVSMVIAETRNLGHWAGIFDGLNDYASRIGAAITAGAYVRHGLFAWQTQVLLGLTAITSFSTTNKATGWAQRLLPKGKTEL